MNNYNIHDNNQTQGCRLRLSWGAGATASLQGNEIFLYSQVDDSQVPHLIQNRAQIKWGLTDLQLWVSWHAV